MRHRRNETTYPTNTDFAFRMMSCLCKIAGVLSEREFLELFSFSGHKKALSQFRRIMFRSYLHINMRRPRIARLKKRSFRVKRLYVRLTRQALCGSWKTPYQLYQYVAHNGLDRAAFSLWWSGLAATERFIFLDACLAKIKETGYRVWFDSLDDNARICVQLAAGGESGAALQF